MKRFIFTVIIIASALIFLSSCNHEHSFSDWDVKEDSTCVDEGEKVRRCECGETESAYIEKKPHTVTEISAIQPGCTTYGNTKAAYCSVCEKYIIESTPIAPVHTYVPNVVTSPGCTAKGVNLYSCVHCDANYAEDIEELGHDYINATCIAPKICKKCNSTEGASLGHTTFIGTCKRCNKLVYPTVVLPELPTFTSNNVFFCNTVLKITKISYRFTPDAVTFTFSAEKTEDAGTTGEGKYFCGFSYKLYDKDGNVIGQDSYEITNLAVGDKIKDRAFTIMLPDNISDTYILVIEDFK